MGSNGAGNGALNDAVRSVAVSGSDLYVGGSFTDAAGIPAADYVARWNGSAWSALGSNGAGDGALNGRVDALAVSVGAVYVGGTFTDAAGIVTADYIAKWNGIAWSALGSNSSGNGALNAFGVSAIAVSGSDLYVGGGFTDAAGIPSADYIAKWNGRAWSALGSNGAGNGALDSDVHAIAVAGADVYVGGTFNNAGGNPQADSVARWNGSAWSALGSNGSGNGALFGFVYAIAVSGADVYVGGSFSDAAGIPAADFVARWNGSVWSALGSDGAGDGALNSFVTALAISANDIYVGGAFLDAAGIPAADRVARWNGSSWSALGSNGAGDGALSSFVNALAASGGDLYVGGFFSDAAGIATADYVAKWALGTGVIFKPDGRIRLGTGAFIGDDVYNTTGLGQSRTGSAARGHGVSFGISIQNDGTGADSFKVKATGMAASGYTIKYLHGTSDITAAVIAGSYRTASLAPSASELITATVTVTSTAAVGSKVSRLVTISSVGDPTKRDAVRLTVKRA